MNVSYGVFSLPGQAPRCGARVGAQVLDLAAALDDPTFLAPRLNPFLAAGPERWAEVASRINLATGNWYPVEEVELHLPFEVADYVDFYASEQHARNVGRILRPDRPELPPNWKHQPLGYHGRSGSIVVSGTPVRRPSGPRGAGDFGPSARLDYEVELGFVVGVPSVKRLSPGDFEDHVFGVCLVNDWSARDLQAWETVPLGPFLGKSFATSISPWITPLNALARVSPPPRDVPLPDYLKEEQDWGLDISFEVAVNGKVLSRPEFREMYWTGAQMLAHLTVNGASVRTGDLFASGTVSGSRPDQVGSLLELGQGFLEDGDHVSISAVARGADGSATDLGTVTGTVLN